MVMFTMTLVSFVFVLLLTAFMIAVATVHEQVHERAQQENRIGQHAQDVGCVFDDEIESYDAEESLCHQPRF
jgi:hypothetical protein